MSCTISKYHKTNKEKYNGKLGCNTEICSIEVIIKVITKC